MKFPNEEKEFVFISGATGYLGEKLSCYLASKNTNLILTGRNPIKLDKVSQEIRKVHEIDIIQIVNDLGESDSTQKITEALEDFQVQHFINCAAVQGLPNADVLSINTTELNRVMSINLYSAIHLTKYFVERWNDKKKHSIIHFSGGGATSPREAFLPYSLSKTALIRFVENAAELIKGSNVTINMISPGIMPSQMQRDIIEMDVLRNTEEQHKALRILSDSKFEPHKVLELCDYLLSTDGSFISGKTISAEWDNWREWSKYNEKITNSDVYTLRRIRGADRNMSWGDL